MLRYLLENLFFHPSHSPVLFLGAFMVIVQEMQDAMNKEIRNLIAEWVLPFKRLSLRGFNRNDHIAKYPWMGVGKRSAVHGKRQDIGWIIALEIVPVQPGNLRVIQEQNAYFRI